MNKKILVAVVVTIVAVGGIYVALPKDKKADNTVPNLSNGSTGESAGLPTYTKADVAKHNAKADCWTIISGSVYRLTDFIPSHPGGDEIVRACGIDATTLFTQRETSDGKSVGSGTPHSSTAQAELAELKIGVVAD